MKRYILFLGTPLLVIIMLFIASCNKEGGYSPSLAPVLVDTLVFDTLPDGSGAIVTTYVIPDDGNVFIPEKTPEGIPIIAISANAFSNNNNIKSISMPSVVAVGIHAFEFCDSLVSVDMPNVTTIAEDAFANCYSLSSIQMPSALTIGNNAFFNCKSLISITAPKITTIDHHAFQHCDALVSIDISSVETIGESVFQSCFALSSVNMPSSSCCFFDKFTANPSFGRDYDNLATPWQPEKNFIVSACPGSKN